MSKRNKSIIISSILLCIFSTVFIVSYGFFEFSDSTKQIVINTGYINMYLDSSNEINLTNMFPETMQNARKETNNYIDFTVAATNEYTSPIYYEIKLEYGDNQDSKTRILDKYLRYELYDLDYSDIDILVFNGNSDDINDKTIYINKFDTNSTEVSHKFRLRVWIDDDTVIGNVDQDYTFDEWNNIFASVKVTVIGDLTEREVEKINVMGTLDSFSSYKSYIKEIYFLNEDQNIIDSKYNNATIKYDITNTDNTVGTTKLKAMNDYGKVLAWLEPIDETYYTLYIASDGYTYLSIGDSLFKEYNTLQNLDLSNVKTNFVTSMSYMFAGSYSKQMLFSNLDVSNFNTFNVANMSYMFNFCKNLISLNLSNFDTNKVNDMSYLFWNCLNLTSLDLSNFDTSIVTNMSYMFYDCSSLTSLDVNNFDTSIVTNMSYIFYGCSKLTSLDVSNFNTSKVINMYCMFDNCRGLINIDLSNFDTSEVIDMHSMFASCSSLTTLDLSTFNTINVTNMGGMFFCCKKIKILDLTKFNTSKVTNMSSMFEGCGILTRLNVSSFDTSKVNNMCSMFGACSSLITLDLSNFDTSSVTNMDSMFCYCTNLSNINININNFNTSKVTTMHQMFFECMELTNLDLSNFDTSNVTNMHYMFGSCENIVTINISSFNTSNVTDMSGMFYYCASLTTIYVGNDWTTSNVSDSDGMFVECYNLVGGSGTLFIDGYSSSYTDKTYAHVDGGTSNPGYLTLKT